jgi:hypothetical protein
LVARLSRVELGLQSPLITTRPAALPVKLFSNNIAIACATS